MKTIVKHDISSRGLSKLCIIVRGTSLYIARINPDVDEIVKEFETANTLYSYHPVGFNRPIRTEGDIILYPKLNRVSSNYDTRAKHFNIMLKSFIIQMIGIFASIDDSGMVLTKFKKKDVGIEYSDNNSAHILGTNIETHGSVYKLINYENIAEGTSEMPLIHLFKVFVKVNIKIPDNYEQILDNILKKKYLPKVDDNFADPILRFWMYLVKYPHVIATEMKKGSIRVTKYLDDDDYQMIVTYINNPKKLLKYFNKKISG